MPSLGHTFGTPFKGFEAKFETNCHTERVKLQHEALYSQRNLD